jgi:glutathione S-transferase
MAVSDRGRMETEHGVLTLYQAEWCPHSSRVRQRLTELMVPFVARPVEPDRADREELRRVSGDDSIPLLVTESGEPIGGADAILAWLDANHAEPPEARRHRAQARAHEA